MDAHRFGWVRGLTFGGCLLCSRPADRHSYAYVTSHIHSDTYLRSQRDTHRNGNLHCHPDADLHGDKHCDLYSISNCHSYGNFHVYVYPNEYGYRDGHANEYALAHAYFHCDLYSTSNRHSYGNFHVHRDSDLYVDIDFDEHSNCRHHFYDYSIQNADFHEYGYTVSNQRLDVNYHAFSNPASHGHVDVHSFCNKYRHVHTNPNIHSDTDVHPNDDGAASSRFPDRALVDLGVRRFVRDPKNLSHRQRETNHYRSARSLAGSDVGDRSAQGVRSGDLGPALCGWHPGAKRGISSAGARL